MQRTGGHKDLVGFGQKPSLGVSFGDRAAQHVDTDEFVAHLVQIGRHIVGGFDERLADRGGGCGKSGGGEADRRRGDLGANGGCDGQGRGAACAAARIEIAVLAQLGVRGGHGRAGDPKRVGHRAFARQARADGDASVDEQQADGISEAVVGGSTSTGRAPVAEFAGQKVHIERSGVHFDRHRKPVCANWIWNNKPVGRIIWS